jgi:diguanylate cyclase (GGDEF)-like protein
MSKTSASAPPDALESRIRAALDAAEPPADWKAALQELLDSYLAQRRILERLTRIADRYQAAEREQSLCSIEHYERKVRRLEKILRISDQYQRMLHELKQKLEYSSNYDALTDLPNRRYMSRRLDEAAALAARHPESGFAVMIADLDHFKTINDRFGHAAGDKVLQATARALEAPLREYDLCARWGGEEFLFLLPSCDRDGAAAMAERLRSGMAAMSPVRKSIPNPTISIGYTTHLPGESTDETLQRADRALYEAKAKGRDCAIGG